MEYQICFISILYQVFFGVQIYPNRKIASNRSSNSNSRCPSPHHRLLVIRPWTDEVGSSIRTRPSSFLPNTPTMMIRPAPMLALLLSSRCLMCKAAYAFLISVCAISFSYPLLFHFRRPHRLQLVKQLQGSGVLQRWRRLATPSLTAALYERPLSGVASRAGVLPSDASSAASGMLTPSLLSHRWFSGFDLSKSPCIWLKLISFRPRASLFVVYGIENVKQSA